MAKTKKLTPEDVKNCKPMAKGGKELITNIRAACLQYALGGTSAILTGAAIVVGNPAWTIAIGAISATYCFACARKFRKEAQPQIKKDYKVR